jgi:hypothetical protein
MYTQFEQELRSLGAVAFDLWLPESHALPNILHRNEQVVGVVYGRYSHASAEETGRGMLVATGQRLLLIDKKPLFVKCDEIAYSVISAITYTKAGVAGTVTVHTRMGDIHVRTFNQKCARIFVEAIEVKIFKTIQLLKD